jgi:hypothetical protein
MGLTKKTKIALDETRILILGAQILLGFQFRAVFSDSFQDLPTTLRGLYGLALLPMIWVVALLIMPGPYHRIVENGEDTGSFHNLVTTIANLALLPFAIALGLDVVVTFGHLFGEVSGVVVGTAAATAAIGVWYVFPLVKRHHREQERAMATHVTEKPTPLDVKIEQMLTEARVILPGAQALFGFQLAIVFTQPFGRRWCSQTRALHQTQPLIGCAHEHPFSEMTLDGNPPTRGGRHRRMPEQKNAV